MSPNCEMYAKTLDRVRALVSSQRHATAVEHLAEYLDTYDGRLFDREIDSDHPDEFTEADLAALRRLRVSALKKARPWLLGEGGSDVRITLAAIPSDKDLWDVKQSEFDGLLGETSSAWKLWMEIFDRLDGAGHSGRGVTAGKLLHGKRPRLIPIYDDKAVKRALNVTAANVWEAFWCVFRSPDIRENLESIKGQVPQAKDLTLLRVLDILVWMSVEKSEVN